MNRFIAALPAPLLDWTVFCILWGRGLPLQASHIASFGAAMALNSLLKAVRRDFGQGPRASGAGRLNCWW